MPVQMNKYKDPRDGSICVMPNSAEKVETKHGIFVRVSDDADNKTERTIVPVTAQSTVSAGGAVRTPNPTPGLTPSSPAAPAKPVIIKH